MIGLAQRREGLHRLLRHKSASLYRDFYQRSIGSIEETFPRTEQEWLSLPFLTKSEFVQRELADYTYVSAEEIDGIRISSGTLGVGLVPVPYTESIFDTTGDSHHPLGAMAMTLYYPGFLNEETSPPGESAKHGVVFGDPTRLAESAMLAAEAGIDALLGTPIQLIRLAPFLKTKYPIENIQRITVLSEPCSRNELVQLFAAYPGVSAIGFGYGAADVKSIASCRIQRAAAPSADIRYHGVPSCHLEVVNEAGAAVSVGEIGELVVTRFKGLGCPLVRYRMGDSVILRGHAEDVGPLFEIRGRVMEESVLIPGGKIFLVELERAIEEATGRSFDFQASVQSHSSGLPYLCVNLFTHDGVSPDAAAFAARLSDTLRINAQRSYTDGVKAGLYAPLECRSELFPQSSHRKFTRLSDLR